MKRLIIIRSISKLILLLLVALSFGSCAIKGYSPSGKASIARISQFNDTANGTFIWSQYDATKRGSVMYVHKGKIRVLAENAPDAALQSITDISAKVKGIESVDVEAAFKTQRTIAQLGKRTAAVNMLRDALYRLNELYYASLDENSDLLKQVIEKGLIKNLRGIDGLRQSFDGMTAGVMGNNEMFEKLFVEIIKNAKDISMSESQAETQIAKSEYEAEIEKQKSLQTQLKLIQEVLEMTENKLSDEESKKLIEQILKTK